MNSPFTVCLFLILGLSSSTGKYDSCPKYLSVLDAKKSSLEYISNQLVYEVFSQSTILRISDFDTAYEEILSEDKIFQQLCIDVRKHKKEFPLEGTEYDRFEAYYCREHMPFILQYYNATVCTTEKDGEIRYHLLTYNKKPVQSARKLLNLLKDQANENKGNLMNKHISTSINNTICDVVLQTLVGLAYMHDVNLVHGALSLDRILQREDGSLAISGFDHVLDAGTEVYSAWTEMPYEFHTDGPQTVQPSLDLYALGVAIYKMCTGHMPFDDGSGVVDMYQLRDHDEIDLPASCSVYRPIVRKLLGKLEDMPTADDVLKMLNTDREEVELTFNAYNPGSNTFIGKNNLKTGMSCRSL